jgi:Trypsin
VWRWRVRGLALVSAILVVAATLVPARAVERSSDRPADLARHPFFVAVTTGTSACAGSVVAPTWVLTVAACVRDTPSDRLFLSLSNGRFVRAPDVIVHPLYDGLTSDGHDLALLRVPATATAGITPIQVGLPWNDGIYRPGGTAVRLSVGGAGIQSGAHRLRTADTVIRADNEAASRYERTYGATKWIGELMIGAEAVDRAPCLRERGDPLVAELANGPVLIGVSSFSLPDCDMPQAFAEMSGSQLAWVASWAAGADTWGPCPRSDGAQGVSAASYGDRQVRPEEVTEGPYYWSITCDPSGPATS